MPTTLQGIESLSDRQKEVLRLTAQHLIAKEIARRLKITERTVRAHTESARQRLGASTSREAVRIFMAYEASQAKPIVSNDQWPSTPIAKTSADEALSGHEPVSSLPDPRTNQLPTRGDSSPDVGGPQQISEDSGKYPGPEGYLPGIRSGQNDLQSDRSYGIFDGTRTGKGWDGLRGRLKTLSALQWLGLVLLVSILFPLILAVLVQSTTGAIQVLQSLNASTG